MTIRTSYKNEDIAWKFKDKHENVFWYFNGKLHRLNGPALEFANGLKVWYIDGLQYSYKNWLIEKEKYLK